jgi:EAL domain-containing protein (putative c-di-GMP-specific phosphodiesterase class I)/FixJ family two-component response regulator
MGEVPHPEPSRTALVLDDEAQIGSFVCKALASFGLIANHFTEPLQFLLEVQRAAPDILIIDLALGHSDAIDVIRKLEFLKFAGRIILISGHDQATLREFERIGRTHGLRMMQSLHKPFRSTELKASLHAFSEPEPSTSASAQSTQKPPAKSPAAALKEALQRDWLEVWYQAKIDLRSFSICGAEALIRARHPERGIINPVDLLPPPGDPLYKPLTLFVIKRVVADWLTFSSRGRALKLAVNVPASILGAPGFVDFLGKALPATSQFPGLIVELTEDDVIRDMAWIYEVATQLRLYNVSLSIDDFGSAYAALARIKDLPFREVKLDRSFVMNCATDDRKRGLCQAVADLTHCFGASACAEGVETLDDLRCLADLGFDTAQGIVFARPMPASHFLEFIATQQSTSSSKSHQPKAADALRSVGT